jgi:hypothetical protein
MYLLKLDEESGALTIDDAFRGPDGKPGFSFAEQAWPHGWTGEGALHRSSVLAVTTFGEP